MADESENTNIAQPPQETKKTTQDMYNVSANLLQSRFGPSVTTPYKYFPQNVSELPLFLPGIDGASSPIPQMTPGTPMDMALVSPMDMVPDIPLNPERPFPQQKLAHEPSIFNLKQTLLILLCLLIILGVVAIVAMDLTDFKDEGIKEENKTTTNAISQSTTTVEKSGSKTRATQSLPDFSPIRPKLCVTKKDCTKACPRNYQPSCNEDCMCVCSKQTQNDTCWGNKCNTVDDCKECTTYGLRKQCNNMCRCQCVRDNAGNVCQRCDKSTDCPDCSWGAERFCDIGCRCGCVGASRKDECPKQCKTNGECPECPDNLLPHCDEFCRCRCRKLPMESACAQRCKTRADCPNCSPGFFLRCGSMCRCECTHEKTEDDCMLNE